MKEYKFVKASEGLTGIKFGSKPIEDNVSLLVEKYAQEGWEVFQFVTLALGELNQIIFVRDKQ